MHYWGKLGGGYWLRSRQGLSLLAHVEFGIWNYGCRFRFRMFFLSCSSGTKLPCRLSCELGHGSTWLFQWLLYSLLTSRFMLLYFMFSSFFNKIYFLIKKKSCRLMKMEVYMCVWKWVLSKKNKKTRKSLKRWRRRSWMEEDEMIRGINR